MMVKGISPEADEQQLIDLFDEAGSVTNVKLLPSNPRYPTCMAFVNFAVSQLCTLHLVKSTNTLMPVLTWKESSSRCPS